MLLKLQHFPHEVSDLDKYLELLEQWTVFRLLE